MKKYTKEIKEKIISFRKKGLTYSEIKKSIGIEIPKSTMSTWCKGLVLPVFYKEKVRLIVNKNLKKARKKSIISKRKKKQDYLNSLFFKNKQVDIKIKDFDVAKIALAVLYLGEGGKRENGALVFGNSNPDIIKLFLKLLRYCYKIDESKFRCTLQCRFNQDVLGLEKFWQEITQISFEQFYKVQIDPRTIGKPSKKKDYKGVCRIDYFSSDVFWDINIVNKILINFSFN